jgi:hypothetical protein
VKNERFLAFALGAAVGVYIIVFILLCIWFPWTMSAIIVASIAFFLILMKKAPHDHELWPDLYKK